MFSKCAVVLFALVHLSLQQNDPKANFCRRFAHQSTVIDQKLYIDGGQVNFGDSIISSPANVTNPYLSYHDLTTSPPQIEMPELWANLSKNATIPNVSGGQIWADSVNKRFFLYGGETIGDTPPTSPQNVYSYDVINNQWDNMGTPTGGINGVAWGAGVGVSSIGQGFVYGGWLSNTSVPGWKGPPMATNTLVKYDMELNKFQNITGPADNKGRAEGVLTYVPASDDGLLIHFGGLESSANGSMVAAPMNIIRIHDIRSSKWYTQTATGDVPPNRRRFCADSAWSDDQSSYNIYLYGGLGFGDDSVGFDDLWILSLPSFKWVNYYKGSPGSPHHSLTCNIVNRGQMLVIGGTFPVNATCDTPKQWGVHNSDIGKTRGRAWESYDPAIKNYTVPPEIINMVGGTSFGGASLIAPPTGFQDPELGVYFSQQAQIDARTPTRIIIGATGSVKSSSVPAKLAPSAIAGIAVGGSVLLSSIIVGACLCMRQRRNNNGSEIRSKSISSNTTSGTKSLPNIPVPQEYLVPESRFSRSYRQKRESILSLRSSHQLPTTPEPAELHGNHYVMDYDNQKYVKGDGLQMRHVDERDHPAYRMPRVTQSPRGAGISTSPNLSDFTAETDFRNIGHYGERETYRPSPITPRPTVSTLGRTHTGERTTRTINDYYNL